MECEAAFKTSSGGDTTFKFSPQAFLEDLSAFNGQSLAPSDDLFVDDLLDFSHQDALPEQPDEPQLPQHDSVSVSPRLHHQTPHTLSAKDEFSSGELILPADDEAHLEWLSHFVEDSFLECSAAYPGRTLPETPKTKTEKPLESETPIVASPCFLTPVPAKARSKRTRTGVRVWSPGFPPIAESSSSSTSNSSSSSSSSSPHSTWLIYSNLNPQYVSSQTKPPTVKKPKKRMEAAGGGAVMGPRRCRHCGVQKTPQWRTGPLGAKTLCNACGVRYKSGRLLPEYRPACSPTFSSELHSNHHRKVLEMRRKKETSEMGSGLETPPAVPSFFLLVGERSQGRRKIGEEGIE